MALPTALELQSVSVVIACTAAILSVSTALLGDWVKERFGFKGATDLKILAKDEPPYLSHSWIRHVSHLPTGPDAFDAGEDDSLRVQVLRVLVTNKTHNSARHVSLWLTEFKDKSAGADAKPNQNVIALRWADTWRFNTDKSERVVAPSEADTTFPVLPSYSSKFCDFAIFYGPEGPPRVDRFERGRLYLAILNMPSRTYSLGPGVYELTLQAVADNARPTCAIVEIEFDPAAEKALIVKSIRTLNRRERQLARR